MNLKEIQWASNAGLEPHITIMVGYPWETREDAWNTFKLANTSLKRDGQRLCK
jgi:radical SAM superfamily enzyme YgiQ (UPF0313 family)